jgi:hypothetical protein
LVPLATGEARDGGGPILSELHQSREIARDSPSPDPQMKSDRRYRLLREGSLKLVTTSQGETFLYDLATDPGETRDLAAERQSMSKMQARLAQVRQQIGLPAIRRADAAAEDEPGSAEATRGRRARPRRLTSASGDPPGPLAEVFRRRAGASAAALREPLGVLSGCPSSPSHASRKPAGGPGDAQIEVEAAAPRDGGDHARIRPAWRARHLGRIEEAPEDRDRRLRGLGGRSTARPRARPARRWRGRLACAGRVAQAVGGTISTMASTRAGAATAACSATAAPMEAPPIRKRSKPSASASASASTASSDHR